MPSAVDIGLYTALTAFVGYEIKEESKDLFSSKDKDHPDSKEFGDGCGKFIHWNKYEEGDNFEKLCLKTQTLNSNQFNLPVWRRSLMVAFIISIIIMIIVHKKLLSFPKFSLYFIILFFMFYYSFNYYSYHYTRPLLEVQNDNLEKMKNKYTNLKKAILRNREKRKK